MKSVDMIISPPGQDGVATAPAAAAQDIRQHTGLSTKQAAILTVSRDQEQLQFH